MEQYSAKNPPILPGTLEIDDETGPITSQAAIIPGNKILYNFAFIAEHEVPDNGKISISLNRSTF
jgi:hypothetical protein